MKLLYFIILMPLISFLILSFFANYLNTNIITMLGIGSIGLSLILTTIISYIFFIKHYVSYNQHVWNIINIDYLHINLNFHVDILAISMLFITLGVGFLIHIFSIWYMKNKEGYARFFAYTNLFIANMLLLILADNFFVMFFGWEGVGICSYLLIGFFYQKYKNITSAFTAFLITRFSDIFFLISMFLIFYLFKTFNFHQISLLLTSSYIYYNTFYIKIIALTLLIGAIGKSAQYPLNTWLINAMSGPTPASALIHAATMVTAGIYLILRNNILFFMAHDVLILISVIGIITILLSGCCALVQNDIKAILAYSTMSQIGYMFLALGVCSWDAALFHIISHAFFKALLFLCAASIIISCYNEQNILYMRGLKKYLPYIYYIFVIGSMSLIAIPCITLSGFTKEKILYEAFIHNYVCLTILGLIGNFITSLYTIRMIYIIFYGENCIVPKQNNGFIHYFPLIILMILSSIIGKLLLPLYKHFVLPHLIIIDYRYYHFLEILSGIISIMGYITYMSYTLNYIKYFRILEKIFYKKNFIKKFFLNGCYINLIYKKLLVNNFLKILYLIKYDPIIQYINTYIINIIYKINQILCRNQNGYIRYYISFMYIGTIVLLLIIINN
ncbi:NADH-quinone oxidoreductase subunit L [Enterobacteriaceae endosymbiont of Neohaemonia nigricornis]|uniref:NADH-quinone oxidoreductase subunit L n=1 Tax=Enterobacteriaceae endosymbiont of Neohaemonia nigricornis TaxID=2675792 RepID=UPI0014492039|nr:NADH-quinone oxidoreductase subunit L [Enterobacteriaceae endosymbiont of Neohaemonia nigricornis]QJC30544.1 NADH-quinone oxidoreductase subunit L [Enterobacteriaceae endosymbiont of Neohaemonia nigricornis]